MDDDAGAQAPQLLWINWTDQAERERVGLRQEIEGLVSSVPM